MKRSRADRRADALARLRASTFENSRAKRKGTATREEWEARKEAEISHLEEMNGLYPQTK
jgi:hypothetical protein